MASTKRSARTEGSAADCFKSALIAVKAALQDGQPMGYVARQLLDRVQSCRNVSPELTAEAFALVQSADEMARSGMFAA